LIFWENSHSFVKLYRSIRFGRMGVKVGLIVLQVAPFSVSSGLSAVNFIVLDSSLLDLCDKLILNAVQIFSPFENLLYLLDPTRSLGHRAQSFFQIHLDELLLFASEVLKVDLPDEIILRFTPSLTLQSLAQDFVDDSPPVLPPENIFLERAQKLTCLGNGGLVLLRFVNRVDLVVVKQPLDVHLLEIDALCGRFLFLELLFLGWDASRPQVLGEVHWILVLVALLLSFFQFWVQFCIDPVKRYLDSLLVIVDELSKLPVLHDLGGVLLRLFRKV